jgi:phage tail-like protein
MSQNAVFYLHLVGLNIEQVLPLSIGTAMMGRQVGNDILLEHSRVSRRHAEIVCTAVSCTITDLGSSNGTLVNDEKLLPNAPVSLNDGDVILIGPFTLTFKQEVVQAAPPPKPEPKPAPPQKKPEPKLEPKPVKAEIPPKQERPSPPKTPPVPPAPPLPRSPAPLPGSLPGLTRHSSRLLPYLPGIYHTDFMSRFLGLFESILTPIEWNIDNFDLFLNPDTAPTEFLPWLAHWYEISFDDSWSEAQRRQLLKEAHQIYGRRGTKWALSRVLEIYTGHSPDIDDESADLDPFTFTVKIPLRQKELNQELIERIIDMNKPAYTSYKLKFKR